MNKKKNRIKRILLIGNPNVGKSVIFSRLTGVGVIASNYPGTTVEFSKGCVHYKNDKIEVIDVPGTYSLEPTSPAEEVAVDILKNAIKKKDSVVINVVDATNLERNLNLTLQLLKMDIPIIIALNLWDEAHHIGISIDTKKLQELLGVVVIPTIAITGEGIKELISRLDEAKKGSYQYEDKERWHEIGKIVDQVQTIRHKHHTIFEKLSDLTIHPWTGIPIASVILILIFVVIRFIGESLISYIFEPIFDYLWQPVVMQLSLLLNGKGIIHDILVGELIDGKIDFGQSFGLLTTGLYVPIAAVLPYVIAFYLVLSFLEDSGYLPRLAILLDKAMHLVGLHGMAIVPMMLGLGCNVPGALGTRVLESKRERFIAATLMAIAIPCMAQLAMVFGLLGKYGVRGLGPVFLTLFIVWLIAGILMNFTIKGESPEIFVEIPPYRLPYFGALLKKVWVRIRWFLHDAIPFVLLGVFIVNLLYSLGIIEFLGKITAPVIINLLGLPLKAVAALIIGFLRKDLAVGMLLPLGLSLKQLIIASVVLTMYFPCVATFAILFKELGFIDMMKSALIMIGSALIVGSVLNLIL